MPRTRTPLPAEWADSPFLTREALARSIPAAYALRAGPDQAISHTTALLLWGAPLPRRIERQSTMHVSSVGPSRPRTRLTTPHRLYLERTPTTVLDGCLITEPAVSWVQSAPLLSLEDLVAAGDFLITGTEPYDGGTPLVRMPQLADAIRIQYGARGIRKAREAFALLRYGSLSRRESFTRLMLTRGGLPEPELNYVVVDENGSTVAMVDLAHVEFRVATEFESLLHLDPTKFRRDIAKQQALADIGWATHRLTSDDVDPRLSTSASRAAVSRIRRSLLARGWNPREWSYPRAKSQE